MDATVEGEPIEIAFNVEQDFHTSLRVGKSRANDDLDGSEVEAGVTILALGVGVRF